MIQARSLPPFASLSPRLVHRRPAFLLLPAPATMVTPEAPEPEEMPGDALRFFLTCYAAGILFFLVMLS